MDKLCIRGGGNLCKKAINDIKKEYKNSRVVFIADKDTSKYGSKIEEIIIGSVEYAVKLYQNGMIENFVIPFGYGIKLVIELIAELKTNNVNESNILFYYNSQLYNFIKIKKILPFQFISFFSKEDVSELILNLQKKIRRIENFSLVLVGDNWLAKYIRFSAKHVNIIQYDDKHVYNQNYIYIICEEAYEFNNIIYTYPDEQIIYLYNIVYYFYFSNALWFETLKNEKKKRNILGIATGISTIRDLISNEEIFNLGNVAQDLYYDFKLFKKFFQLAEKKPLFTIIGLGPLAFCYDMSLCQKTKELSLLYYPEIFDLHNLNNKRYYALYYEKEIKKIKEYLKNFSIEECFEKFYFAGKKGILNLYNGKFSELRLSEIEIKKFFQENKKLFYESKNNKTEDNNKKILLEYLEFCRKHNVNIFILFPPFTNFYKKIMDKQIFQQVKQFVLSKQEEYKIKIIDLSELELKDEYFYDYKHLNKKGREYTKRFIDKNIQKYKHRWEEYER